MSFEWLITTLSEWGYKLYNATSGFLFWFFERKPLPTMLGTELQWLTDAINVWFPEDVISFDRLSFAPADVLLWSFGAFLLYKAFIKLFP